MDIWPVFKWLKVLSQPWEGDVTMVLPSSFMQIKKSITNPSLDDLKEACLQARLLPCSMTACLVAQMCAGLCTPARCGRQIEWPCRMS